MEQSIDILLATYNGEKYIPEQLDSILGQTYQTFRLLISDDGSTDKTREILEQYAKKDSRIVLFLQEKNLGYIRNFEFLLKQVTSAYFMLSDQDDVWLPNKIETSMACLNKEGADFVFGDLQVVDQELHMQYPSFGAFMQLDRKIKTCLHKKTLNYLYNCVTGCTILAKSTLLKKMLPIPNTSKYVAHDHWMGLMASLYGKMAYVPETYILYRQHGDNQIGTEKISHGFSTLGQVRRLFIDVKLGIFETYVKHSEAFPKEMQEKNQKALAYYEMINQKENLNFRKWRVFHELYKEETVRYYILNFIIMNLPLLGRPLFQLRYHFLRLRKRKGEDSERTNRTSHQN